MKLSMITCGLGTTFGLLAMPGTLVVTAFYRDSLGATNSQIGWLAGISLLSFSAGIFGSYLFDRVRSRKAVWIPLALYWRLSGFGLAGLTIYAARGGDKQFVIYASMVLIAVTYPAIYLGSPGWLGWFADLFPEKTRGRFIGRRLAVAYLIAIPVTLGAMFLVHHFGKASPEALMYAMAGVFTLAGIIGVVDIILCMWIPEPRRPVPKKKITIGESVKSMLTALTDARYRGFLFASMALSFAVQIRAPFFGPYFKTTLGVPYYWLAIAPCIFFLGQILTAKPWGLLADRFGSRPTMAIGVLWGIPLLLYFFASPENFAYILTAVHFLCGAVWTGLNISIFQMNMTQAPKGKTEACAGVKFAMVGIVGHFGAVLGGKLADYFESAPAGGSALPGIGGLGTMHKLILVSLGLQFLVALPLILRMRERKHRPVSPLLALLLTRNVLRLSANIGIIGGAYAPSRKVKALRTLKTPRDGIATEEIVGNLEDPDDEVRSEAVLALGRVGGPEALRRLTQLLADKGSGVRCEAAQSLGAMRDPAAIEHLLNALGDDSEEVRQAASRAVGEIRAAEDPLIPTDAMLSGSPVERAAARKRASVLRRVKRTRRRVDTEEIMRSLDDNDRDVRAEAALALGRVGETAALDRLSRLLNDPDSGVRREAAQALGMIGDERALEPLLEAIGGNAEEVRHAAAKALGQVGGDASKSLLRDIVKSSGRVDGVTATSAEAVSRFGNVAALMEIYPRMHQTDNPVLRNQLAIASGNLLGRPGEFYDILSQLRAGRHEVWDKLVRLSQRNVRQWADYAVREHGLDAREVETQKRQMLKRLTALAKQVEGEKWPAAIKTLRRTVGRVATFVFGDMAGAMPGDAAYLANPRYAMGLWFTSQVEQRLPQAGAGSADDRLLMTDCLLSLYFLSRFRPEQDLS